MLSKRGSCRVVLTNLRLDGWGKEAYCSSLDPRENIGKAA